MLQGIVKFVGHGAGFGVYEGQYIKNCMTGFGRKIFANGSFHCGWWKGDDPYGFGVGNHFTGGTGVKQGLYEKKWGSKPQESHFKGDDEQFCDRFKYNSTKNSECL